MSDNSEIRRYYLQRRHASEGNFARLGWESPDAQEKRFQILLDALPLTGRSLLDIGCGLGDLYDWLLRKQIDVDYTGVDLLPEFVGDARIRFPKQRFICADLSDSELNDNAPYDVLFSSGILNIRTIDNLRLLDDSIRRMRQLGDDAVVFNFLSHSSPDQESPYYYYDPQIVVECAQRHFDSVRLVEDYLPNDGTAICRVAPVRLFTDGGCSGNPGPGGWGYIIEHGGRTYRSSGYESKTTNNRMEINAVLSGLQRITNKLWGRDRPVHVYTDSRYVKEGITVWLERWQRNGWRTANRKPVKNRDLWQELWQLCQQQRHIEWYWVQGHAGNLRNEECHALVQKAIAKSEASTTKEP